MIITVTLLDFSSGDTRITTPDGKETTVNTPTATTTILAFPDTTKVTLKRDYAKGTRKTTVGELRTEIDGWWGW